MENACYTCAVGHYVTKNKLFLANKALDLCGVIRALRQGTIWTDRWMKPAPSTPLIPTNPCFWQKFTEPLFAEERYHTEKKNVLNMYKIFTKYV